MTDRQIDICCLILIGLLTLFGAYSVMYDSVFIGVMCFFAAAICIWEPASVEPKIEDDE